MREDPRQHQDARSIVPSLKVPFEEPVSQSQARLAGRGRWPGVWFRLLASALILGSVLLALAAWMAIQVFWSYGGRSLTPIEAHFQHGSIGAELANGMPYRMLKALPKVFPEYFGDKGDWSHFGLILAGGKDGQGLPLYKIYEAARDVRNADGTTRHVAGRLSTAADDPRTSRGLPIGFATGWRLGIEMAWFNCAVCHTGVVQVPGDPHPRIVPGMPANTLNLERLFLALFDMAVDKRFTFQRFAEHFTGSDALWFYERPLWEWIVVPNVRAELIARRSELLPLLDPKRAPPVTMDPSSPGEPAFCEPKLKPKRGCSEAIFVKPEEPYRRERLHQSTAWGPGRVDTFNPYKLINFEVEADCLRPEERIGASDFPSIFQQGARARRGMHLHWDGNNASIAERNLSAALGAGVNERTVDHGSLARIVDWLSEIVPPPSPYSGDLDRASVERGREIYKEACQACHGYQGEKGYVFEGSRLGQIEPLAYVGTDRGRLDSYTLLIEKYQKDRLFCTEPEHRFRQFKKTNGYANAPLDGLWLRAPYLHNGSVPTLWDLLQPASARPRAFRRGAAHIKLDPAKGGFDAPDCLPGEGEGPIDSFCFDTRQPGNSSEGHLYGTDLTLDRKKDLLSYLLTF